jgi:hypothetical protein
MDITQLSDIELAKILSEQQDLLAQSAANVQALKAELKKRIEKAKEEKAE